MKLIYNIDSHTAFECLLNYLHKIFAARGCKEQEEGARRPWCGAVWHPTRVGKAPDVAGKEP